MRKRRAIKNFVARKLKGNTVAETYLNAIL
jgi:hypothetical protein